MPAGDYAIVNAPHVGWDDDPLVASWRGLPPLPGDRAADACVIGLGASGLAAVEALAERGMSVIGLDAGRVAALAAGRNGGFLLAGAAHSLHEAVDAWGPGPAVALYRATLAELDRLAAALPEGVLRRTGSLRLAGLPGPVTSDEEAADREREAADCAAHAAALKEHGFAAEAYAGPLGTGVYLPDGGIVNPAVRALSLAAPLSARAALHEHTRVLSVAAGEVRTEHGSVRAPVIVVASDGGLTRLLPALADRVRTARLQMLVTAPVPRCLDGPVYSRWGYDYAQQHTDGRIYAGGGRDRFVDAEWVPPGDATGAAEPTPAVQDYIETVAARMAGRPVTVRSRWAAPVGFTNDGRPVCVEVDDGVVGVGGYSGTGNLVGPVAARAAVAYAVDGTKPPAWLTS